MWLVVLVLLISVISILIIKKLNPNVSKAYSLYVIIVDVIYLFALIVFQQFQL